MMNKVILIGRLTRDPELRRSNTGMAVCNFSVAVNRGFASQNNEPQTEPCPGCKSGELKDMRLHTGIQCQIKDWDLENDGKKKKVIYFHELMK